MPVVLSIIAALSLIVAAVLAGRYRQHRPALPAVGKGERVLAVIRPDAELVLSVVALHSAVVGLVLGIASLLLGDAAEVPLALSLAILAAPVAAERMRRLGVIWVVTDRRLIAGPGLEVALADLARLRLHAAALEVETRAAPPGPAQAGRRAAPRCLRLESLVDPAAAARAICNAARAQGAAPLFPRLAA